MNENRATCIMPWVEAEGWVDLEVSLDGGPFYWKGQFFVGKTFFNFLSEPISDETVFLCRLYFKNLDDLFLKVRQ